MRERLQKIISARGLASRRKAEELIKQGSVTVNGITASLGDTADTEKDIIEVNGKPLPEQQNFVYIMLNKPRGYVTTLSDEKGRPNAAQLVSDCGVRVYPIGRLDMDSEGLLLFTNDGDFANTVMHPKREVEKTYEVWVSGYTPESTAQLSRPIILDGYQIHPPKITLIYATEDKAKFLITIHEGRNRQIRRMCEAAGMHCTRLRRIQEGSLKLDELPKGKWRHLTSKEILALNK